MSSVRCEDPLIVGFEYFLYQWKLFASGGAHIRQQSLATSHLFCLPCLWNGNTNSYPFHSQHRVLKQNSPSYISFQVLEGKIYKL